MRTPVGDGCLSVDLGRSSCVKARVMTLMKVWLTDKSQVRVCLVASLGFLISAIEMYAQTATTVTFIGGSGVEL